MRSNPAKIEYQVPFDAPNVKAFTLVAEHAVPRRTAKALAFSFVLLIGALAFVPWQQTAYGDGQVVAYSPSERPQPIEAPVAGRVSDWYVREGTRVQKGDPVVRIVDVDPALLERLRAELDAMQARVAAAQAGLKTARLNVRRQADLLEEGLSSRIEFEKAVQQEAEARKDLADARASVIQVERRLAQQDIQLVTAPRDGVIARLIEGQGTMLVEPGDELALLVPVGVASAVELWVDGNELPLVSDGDEVRVQFEGWPALQMSGWPAVAVGTFGGRVATIDPADVGHPGEFRILVRPGPEDRWPAPELLRQGIRAHGWVLLRRVPLGFELWRRFNDFPPSRAAGEKAAVAPTRKKP